MPADPTNGLDLRAFLDSQTSQGVVDSHGAFTVSRDKALEKLASFGLQGNYDWVLKIVQAVNVWKAPRLVVRQSRVATSFFFCPPAGALFPTESSIIEALGEVKLDDGNPVHQLGMALRSLVHQVGLSFVLAVREGGQQCAPVYAGDDVSGLDPDTHRAWTTLKTEGVRLTVSHFTREESQSGRYVPHFSRQVRRDVSILRILEGLCYASPVPIEVDRRLITRIFPRGDLVRDSKQRPLLVGSMIQASSEKFEGVEMEAVTGQLDCEALSAAAGIRPTSTSWFAVMGPDWRMSNLAYEVAQQFFRPMDGQSLLPNHEIWWVRHGVLVGGYQFPAKSEGGTKLMMFLPADRMRSDLSGLKVDLPSLKPIATYAMAALEKVLRARLLDGTLANGLQSEPASEPPQPVMESVQDDVIEQAGESLFTRSIGINLPVPTQVMMSVTDRAIRLLAHLPGHDARLREWARLSCERLGHLVRDLSTGSSWLLQVEISAAQRDLNAR